jgi:outer membrane lipoprotein-sorting protein
MNDLTEEQFDRLESAIADFDRADGVAKARLLAALAADGPPQLRIPRRTRFEIMKRRGTRLAMVATLIVAAVGAWQMTRPRSLFARAARAMIDAKGYRCDLVVIVPAAEGQKAVREFDRLFWSSGGEQRIERTEGGEGGQIRVIEIHRPGEPGLRLMPKSKEYQVLSRTYATEFSYGMFAHLSEYKGDAGKPRGVETIEGRAAEEYVVPWSQVIGDDSHKNGRMRMWLDPTTNLPLRVDIVGMGPKDGFIFRLENFRWGAQDPALFDTKPPADFTKLPTLDFKTDEITDYVIQGLSTFAKYNQGKYPAVKYVYGDEQGEALRKLMGMDAKAQGWRRPSKDLKWKDPKEGEFAYGSYAMSWINTLQRDYPECVYHGKTVTPKDVGKILLRWKLDDGEYRVIYGDLKWENVSADRLKVLEAK